MAMTGEHDAKATRIKVETVGFGKPRQRVPCNDEVELEALKLVGRVNPDEGHPCTVEG